jgi:hypothetical protein
MGGITSSQTFNGNQRNFENMGINKVKVVD